MLGAAAGRSASSCARTRCCSPASSPTNRPRPRAARRGAGSSRRCATGRPSRRRSPASPGAHAAMVAVMVMTPLHMEHGGAELRVIGIVISVHVLGMFAFSPLVGLLADRVGRPPVLASGGLLLIVSLALCHGAPEGSSWQIFAGLFLLGLGWSFATVAASTMITDDSPLDARTDVQGAADLIMGLTAAAAGGIAGVVVGGWGYHALALLAMAAGRTGPVRGLRRGPSPHGCHSVPMTAPVADVAVIGGSGFYSFLDDPEQHPVETPYGAPSAPVSVGTVAGRRVAFLPRHGRAPRVPAPPHQLPRQPLGAPLARRPPGPGAVCGRRPADPRSLPATWSSPTSWSTAPGAGPRATSRPAPATCRSPIPTAPGCPAAVAAAGPGREARRERWSWCRDRGSRPGPSRSTTPRRAGR